MLCLTNKDAGYITLALKELYIKQLERRERQNRIDTDIDREHILPLAEQGATWKFGLMW